MPKLTLNNLNNLQNESSTVTIINGNNDATETALENTLSRDGTSPNEMNANLDMNTHRILNLPDPINNQEPVTFGFADDRYYDTVIAAEASAVAAAASANAAWDNFDDKYLGAKPTDPTSDNDGNPVNPGALYFNTGTLQMKVWTGVSWADAVGVAGVSSFNGRAGIVVPVSGDYPASLVPNTPAGGISATNVQAAINELDTEKFNVTSAAAIASSGSASDLVAGTVPAARMPAHTGDVTSSTGSVSLLIPNNTVTYAKMQDVSATSRILGRATAGAGDPEELTTSQALDFVSSTQGDMLIRGASSWSNIQVGAGPRERLTAPRAYYVRADGSDSNTGLGNTAGTAFLTIQKAINTIASIDLNIYDCGINVGPGTYTGPVVVNKPFIGSGNVYLSGDTTTPSNVVLNVSGNCITTINGAAINVQGFKFISTGAALLAQSLSILRTTGKNEFGACVFHGYADNARLEAVSPEVISGNSTGSHYYCVSHGVIYCQGASWTFSGTPNVSVFAWAPLGGLIYAFSNSVSGTCTGQRYNATVNSIITSNGGGASYFPGSTAGSTATGGQYA